MIDTIFALATPSGRSGVAVVRISGPLAFQALGGLTGRDDFEARRAVLCGLYAAAKSPSGRDLIDKALVISFAAPASFTGEDVVELQPHGSPAVLRALMDELGAMDGLRLAEPGEFTRRAFENGKLDLTEAEAVADLIDAETQMQRQQALVQMGGGLSDVYEGWTEALKRALAHMEADLEFPDEDMPDGVMPMVMPVIDGLIVDLSDHLNDNRRGERLRDGLQVAVIGAPNAGKSSLVNALVQRDVAIVSNMAGTTRDVIEAHLDVGGYPMILADTAGLRPDQMTGSAQDLIESEGIKRALERAWSADIRVIVFDGTLGQVDADTLALCDEASVIVLNKADMFKDSGRLVLPESVNGDVVEVSATDGSGIDGLLQALTRRAESLIGLSEVPSLTRRRHRVALEEALVCLQRSQGAALPELMVEDVRLAIRGLGRITGRVDVEDLLDVIFRDFCIGK